MKTRTWLVLSLAPLALHEMAVGQATVRGPYNFCLLGTGDVDADGVPDYYGDMSNNNGTMYSGKSGAKLFTSVFWCKEMRRYPLGVATGGDVDGDGIPDLIYSNPYALSSKTWVPAGEVYVFSGKTGALMRVNSGINTGDEFGHSVCFVGDVDNDKHDDYAVAVPHTLNSTVQDTQIFSGRTGARIKYVGQGHAEPIYHLRLMGDIDHDGKMEFLAAGEKRSFLYSTSTTGHMRSYAVRVPASSPVDAGLDVDKDGTPDFVFGIPENWSGAGTAHVHSGKDGALLHTFKGFDDVVRLGASVALIEDLNGDGHADILIGSKYGVVPRTGSRRGTVVAYSGRTGAVLFTIGEDNYAMRILGTGVGVIGDLTGDRVPEVAIPRADGVYIYDLMVGGAYGTGCASTVELPTLRTEQPPRVAGTFELEASNLLTNTSGVLVIGASAKVWGSVPLPLDLAFMGMGGCRLLCSFDLLVAFTTTTGRASFKFNVPMDYSLLGRAVFDQTWSLDPGANPTGIATSHGVRNWVKQ